MVDLLLSAALIVRNEERFLVGCLDSLEGFVDEVVLVDTGSTDATPRIAADRGITVHTFPWADDFSAARNRALDLARGEWILYIDADERIRAGAEHARKRIQDPRYIGLQVLLSPTQGSTPYWVLRLFRNRPSIRFRGIIHENIWPALTEYQSAHGGKVGSTGLELDHFGYEDQHARKNERNLPLLERALKEDPERIYSWCHLADIRVQMGMEAAAIEAWDRAMEIARRRVRPLADDCLPWAGRIEFELRRQGDQGELIEEALSRFPDNLHFCWHKAMLCVSRGRFEEAIPYFERLAQCGETENFPYQSSYDRRILGVLAYEGLATCCFRLARWAQAVRHYDAALRCEPERRDLRAKRELAASKAAR